MAAPQQPSDRRQEISAAYIDAARRVASPEGAYALIGYSFGGLVAYEMARQSTQAGETRWRPKKFDDEPVRRPQRR